MTPALPQVRPLADAAAQSLVDVQEARREGRGTRRSQPPCLDSEALLQGQTSVSIQHNGSVYRLQATKLGKLILTK